MVGHSWLLYWAVGVVAVGQWIWAHVRGRMLSWKIDPADYERIGMQAERFLRQDQDRLLASAQDDKINVVGR